MSADELRALAREAHERQPAPPMTDEQVVSIRTAFNLPDAPRERVMAA